MHLFVRISTVCLYLLVIGVLSFTAVRMLRRASRFQAIDTEVMQGHATDRWGASSDPQYDAGAEWGVEQKRRDDMLTMRSQIGAGLALGVLALVELRRRKRLPRQEGQRLSETAD